MTAAFTHRVRVRYSEVDNQGHVYNSRYLEYIDHACTMWLRSRGLIYEELRQSQWDFVLRHADVDWLVGAGADEVLEVGVSLVGMGESSFEVAFEIRRPPGDRLLRARVVYVSWDPLAGAKAPLPGFVRAALAAGT